MGCLNQDILIIILNWDKREIRRTLPWFFKNKFVFLKTNISMLKNHLRDQYDIVCNT